MLADAVKSQNASAVRAELELAEPQRRTDKCVVFASLDVSASVGAQITLRLPGTSEPERQAQSHPDRCYARARALGNWWKWWPHWEATYRCAAARTDGSFAVEGRQARL